MILPTDAELVDAAALTYDAGKITPLASDFGKSVVAYRFERPDGLVVIAFEGTHTAIGWALDFLALPWGAHATAKHPTLGLLHAGFYTAGASILSRVADGIGGHPWAAAGHSLGGALALLVGGLLADAGTPPVKIGAFAPPRVGGQVFVDIIETIPISAYRFGDDPVPEVPFTLAPDFDYRQVPLIAVGSPVIPPWKCHAITNYVTAVKAHAAC